MTAPNDAPLSERLEAEAWRILREGMDGFGNISWEEKAAHNLLQEAAELARRVEGAQVDIVETMDDRKGYQANAVECDHLELGQRVRIVVEE